MRLTHHAATHTTQKNCLEIKKESNHIMAMIKDKVIRWDPCENRTWINSWSHTYIIWEHAQSKENTTYGEGTVYGVNAVHESWTFCWVMQYVIWIWMQHAAISAVYNGCGAWWNHWFLIHLATTQGYLLYDERQSKGIIFSCPNSVDVKFCYMLNTLTRLTITECSTLQHIFWSDIVSSCFDDEILFHVALMWKLSCMIQTWICANIIVETCCINCIFLRVSYFFWYVDWHTYHMQACHASFFTRMDYKLLSQSFYHVVQTRNL